MNTVEYLKLGKENFNENSMDTFVRHQEVKECYRLIDGEWKLVPIEFVEEWDAEELKRRAIMMADKLTNIWYGYGAYLEGKVVGYIIMSNDRFGSRNQYAELVLFHVSEPFRQMGIGKQLFHLVCEEAKRKGVERLYISAHSSKESQEAYRKLGCTLAEEINVKIAEDEPYDVQMEYKL